jgi:hypothetical protein
VACFPAAGGFQGTALASNAGFGINEGPRAVIGNQGNSAKFYQGMQNKFPPVVHISQGPFTVGSGPNTNVARRVNYLSGGYRYFKKQNSGGGNKNFFAPREAGRVEENSSGNATECTQGQKRVGAAILLNYPNARAQGSGSQGQRSVGQGADFITLDASNVKSGPVISNKKAKKENCYRCDKPRHHFFDCTAVLCDYCELADLKSENCPLLNAPKPQIIVHGYADEKLVFFECLITWSYKPKLESTRIGILSVTGGELYNPQIATQLRRLVPSEDFH